MNAIVTFNPFKRYASSIIAENAYVAIEEDQALVVDPNQNESIVTDLLKANVTKVLVLLTHEHPDHTCGIPALQSAFATEIACTHECACSIAVERKNYPTLVAMMLIAKYGEKGKALADKIVSEWEPYVCHATHEFANDEKIKWGSHTLHVKSTPGHSAGSCCIDFDGKYLFTGDSLLGETPVIMRLPGGDPVCYRTITQEYLRGFVSGYVALPGHGDAFAITEDVIRKAVI